MFSSGCLCLVKCLDCADCWRCLLLLVCGLAVGYLCRVLALLVFQVVVGVCASGVPGFMVGLGVYCCVWFNGWFAWLKFGWFTCDYLDCGRLFWVC